MKKSKIISYVVLTILVGCATNNSQSQFEADSGPNRVVKANKNVASCVTDAKRNEQVARFYSELIYEQDDSSNKFTLIAVKEKLNDEQIEVMKQAIPILSKCREKYLSDLSGTPFQQSMNKYYSATEAIYIKMIKKELTVGEANEEKTKAVAQSKNDWANAANEANNRANAENESRRQAAAAMLPYMMQQQQNLQLNQQLQYQQQLQNINNNRPILTSPITTNCQTNGNQTNCTSR